MKAIAVAALIILLGTPALAGTVQCWTGSTGITSCTDSKGGFIQCSTGPGGITRCTKVR